MALRPCIEWVDGAPCGIPCNGARCPAHKRARQRQRDLERGSPAHRGYDAHWRRISKAARAAQPWCSDCGATTDLTADHPVPLAHGGHPHQLPVVLCRSCNSRRGATTRRHDRRGD